MLRQVIYCGRPQAESAMPISSWAVISITEPGCPDGQARLQPGWHSVLRLEFHDLDANSPEWDIAAGQFVFMNEQHAHEVIEFVDRVAGEVDTILVHCRAGISRSAAVAKFVANRFGLEFDHGYPLFNKHVFQTLEQAARKR
ncbi:MAG TPA: hypothetical protein VFF74_10835 [Methylophilaceae bacterium]|nr:hypothetical protein [Methylophilaceae bacterium]